MWIHLNCHVNRHVCLKTERYYLRKQNKNKIKVTLQKCMQLVVISLFDCKIERTTHEKHNSPREPILHIHSLRYLYTLYLLHLLCEWFNSWLMRMDFWYASLSWMLFTKSCAVLFTWRVSIVNWEGIWHGTEVQCSVRGRGYRGAALHERAGLQRCSAWWDRKSTRLNSSHL